MQYGIQARSVLLGAAAEARSLGHSYVGSVHLLIALAKDRGIPGRLLRGAGAEPQLLYDMAAVLYGMGESGLPLPQGFTGRMRRVLRGARQEAQSGFPTARYGAQILAETGNAHTAFLSLLLRCEDTNLLYRGGAEGLAFAKAWANRVLNAPAELRPSLLKEMDEAFIARRLSPGGTADLLALSLFLHRTKNIWH